MLRNPVTLALLMAYLFARRRFCPPFLILSGWQRHTFLWRNTNLDQLSDPEIEFGLSPDPDFTLPGIDEIIDDLAKKYPVCDLAGKHVGAVAAVQPVGEDEVLGPGAHQHRLAGRDCLGEAAAKKPVR